MKTLCGALQKNLDIYLKGKKVTAVLGVFKDKEYEKMIGIMTPYLDYVYAIDLPNRDRTLAKEELCEVLAKYGIGAEPAVYRAGIGAGKKTSRKRWRGTCIWFLILSWRSDPFGRKCGKEVENGRQEKVERAVRLLLEGIGEDVTKGRSC